jgi:hypothetical protein
VDHLDGGQVEKVELAVVVHAEVDRRVDDVIALV